MTTAVSVEKARDCMHCRHEGCALFEALRGTASWTSYLQARTLHRFKARQAVFHEGAPAPTVYVLCHGEVKLSIAGPSGTSRIVHIVSAARTPCDMLDKASLGASVHFMTCETLTDCQMCCIGRGELVWLMRQEQGLAHNVLAAASAEAGALLQQLRDGMAIQARQRLAKVLVNLADRHGVPTTRGVELELGLRRREWAELVGISRETVARLLNAFHREGLLALNGRRITILGYDRLNRLAE